MSQAAPSGDKRRASRPPGRRPLAEGNADDTRRLIRSHAGRLFNERGYAAVSVEDIAGAAGVTRATLYYHYRGKADIFVETVLATAEFVSTVVSQITSRADLPVADRVVLLVTTWREADAGGAHLSDGSNGELDERTMTEALPHLTPRQQARAHAAFEGIHHPIRALMAEGVASGELRPVPADVLEYVFFQLFQPHQYPQRPGLDRQAVEDHLLSVLLDGAKEK